MMNNDCNINSTQLNGFYRGLVLKHLSDGKCKIWIPGVYAEEDWENADNINKLPSAEQASSFVFGANSGNGIFSYPNLRSVVWCFFERGDQNCPVYFASTLGNASSSWNEAYKMPGEKDDAYIHYIKAKKSTITINEMGYIDILTSTSNGKCQLTLDDQGNTTLECSGTLTLKATNVIVNGSTQVDIKSSDIKQIGSTLINLNSPAIEVDSANGHTTIKSRAAFSPQNPASTGF